MSELIRKEEGPFPYDSGTADGPVLLDCITLGAGYSDIVEIEPSSLGSFGAGWPSSK
jgi:hypothetical protein